MYNPGPQMGELENGNDGTLTGFVMFDCLGTVEMRITYNGGPLTRAQVWPQSYGITPTVNGNVITFPINGIKNIVLEINGNQYEALHIFANPIDTNIPSPGKTNVMFFGAGLHEYGNDTNIQRFTVKAWHSSNRVTEDVINVPSGKTVYIQGGAVVKAQIRTNPFWNGNGRSSPKNNVTIRGRGVIDCSQWCGNFTEGAKIDEPEMPGMVLFCASNVTAEGVVIVNPPRFGLGVGHGAQNVIVNNVKEFTSMLEGDGMDVLGGGCSNVTVENCFIRCADDACAVDGGCSSVTYSNDVIYPMRTHAFMIGIGTGVLTDFVAENCYIETEFAHPVYRGVFSLNAANYMQNVIFKNIQVERTVQGGFLDIYPYSFWNGVGGSISNVFFENVYYNTNINDLWSPIGGINDSLYVANVNFSNCYYGGSLITNSASGHLSIGNYASYVTFNGVPLGARPIIRLQPRLRLYLRLTRLIITWFTIPGCREAAKPSSTMVLDPLSMVSDQEINTNGVCKTIMATSVL